MARSFQLVVLSLFVAWAVAQSCSDNPLLKRADIQARFGGSTNVRASAATAGSSLPVCKYLQGKSSCVTDAGYEALANNIQSQKDTIVSEGASKNKRFANVTSLVDRALDCYGNLVAITALAVDMNLQSIGTDTKLQIKADTYNMLMASLTPEMEKAKSDVMGYARNVTAAKATCARNLIRYYTFVSCEASNPDYSATVSGSSENPSTKVKTGFCSTVANDCRNYIQGLQYIAGAQNEISAMCLNTDLQNIGGKLRRNESVSSADFIAAQARGSLGNDGSSVFVGSKVSCGSSCNFVCNSVFTGVGFKVNAFTDLNPDSNSRLLQSGSGSLQESNSAKDPVELTKDDNTEVPKESDSMGSSAAGLIINIAMVVLAAFLTL